MQTYTTRTEAIDREIVEPLEAGAVTDEVLGDHDAGFPSKVTPDEFWTTVERHARQTFQVDMTAEDVSVVEDPDGEMRELTELRVIIPETEDSDMTVIDGETVLTGIAVPASETWEPETYRTALAAAGWTVIGEIPSSFTAELAVVRSTS